MVLEEIDIPEVRFGQIDEALKDLFCEGCEVVALLVGCEVIWHLRQKEREAGGVPIIQWREMTVEEIAVSEVRPQSGGLKTIAGYKHPITGSVIPFLRADGPPWRVQFEGFQCPEAQSGASWECGCASSVRRV